jgi:branched-chain amino acid transport system substrate-binding protein
VNKLALAVSLALAAGAAAAQDKVISIAGFGAKSGVVRSFGVNSEAALLAAADVVYKGGGVKLADGSKAKIAIEFYDDRCNAEEGSAAVSASPGPSHCMSWRSMPRESG